jgi:hypothetical protein
MIRENSPFCTAVTGRPRTPRDQGSVVNMNYHVRKALYALEEHDRRKGKEPNWTTKMGQTVAAMTSKVLKGRGQVSPFHSVFGMDYMDEEREDVAILRQCSTVADRIDLKKNSDFLQMMEDNCWTKIYDFSTENLSPNDAYWSDDDTIQNDLEELPLVDPDGNKDVRSAVLNENRVDKDKEEPKVTVNADEEVAMSSSESEDDGVHLYMGGNGVETKGELT